MAKKQQQMPTELKGMPEPKPATKELVIRFNPVKLAKGTIFVALLVLAFFAGQWTADGDLGSNATGAAIADNLAADVDAVEVEVEPETEPAAEANLDAVEPGAEPETEPEPEAEAEEESNEVPLEDQEVLTEYEKVEVVLDGVQSKGMGTWGKMERLDITLTNNDKGIIEPYEINLIVKGYEDREKRVPWPDHLKQVGMGQTVKPSIEIEGGYSYNEGTLGGLNNVGVTIVLLDKRGTVIKSYMSNFKLN